MRYPAFDDGLERLYKASWGGVRAERVAALHPLEHRYRDVCGNWKPWAWAHALVPAVKFLSMDIAIKPGLDCVNTAAQGVLDNTYAMDEGLHYLGRALFNPMHTSVQNSQAYSLKEEKLDDLP